MITKLTSEQNNRLIEFRDEWLAVGLSTEPADFETAERIMTGFYARIGKPKPTFLRCAGLLSAQVLMNLVGSATLRATLSATLSDMLSDTLSDTLNTTLSTTLSTTLRNTLSATLRDTLRNTLNDTLRDTLSDTLYATLRDTLSATLRDTLRATLSATLRDTLNDTLRDTLNDTEMNFFHTWLWGSLDSYWIAYYLFPHNEIKPLYKPQDAELLNEWVSLARSAFWIYPFDNVCIICDRPSAIRLNARKQPHGENAPSIEFRDGWKLWHWNGVAVPQWVIETPEKITPELITAEQNSEVRRVMLERYGWEKMLYAVGAKLVDKHPDNRIGELWRWNEPDGTPVQIIKVLNGTPDPETGGEKWYSKRVPVDIRRAIDGNRWTYPVYRHLSDDDYIIVTQNRA